MGWWKQGAQVEEKALIRRYTGMTDDDVAYCFIREAFKSCAQTAVVTMQVGRQGARALKGLARLRVRLLEAVHRHRASRTPHTHRACSSPLHPRPATPGPALQDIMRLDDTARMNTPGRAAGNWTWRVGGSDVWRQLREEQAQLRAWVHEYDRAPPGGIRAAPPAPGRAGTARFH